MPVYQVQTPSKIKKAYEMYHKEKLKTEEIGKHFGVTKRCVSNWVNKEEERLKEKKKKQIKKDSSSNSGKKTKKEILLEWLKDNPNGTFFDFLQESKIKVHNSYFNNIKSGKNYKRKSSPKSKKNGTKEKEPKKNGANELGKINTIQQLLEENEFLKWWNEGERKNFVEKLINALDPSSDS